MKYKIFSITAQRLTLMMRGGGREEGKGNTQRGNDGEEKRRGDTKQRETRIKTEKVLKKR